MIKITRAKLIEILNKRRQNNESLDLCEYDLSNVNLCQLDLSGCILCGPLGDLTGANLCDTDLTNADLTESMLKENFLKVSPDYEPSYTQYNAGTKFPERFNRQNEMRYVASNNGIK